MRRRLRNLRAIVAMLLGSAALSAATPGEIAPALQARTIEGRPIDLASNRGRVVLVDFWASWCGPCRQSFPAIDSLARRYASRGLVVVGVSVDDDPGNCLRFVRELRPSFDIVHDRDHAIAERWSPDTMPTSFVVDRAGRIRVAHTGFSPGDERQLEAEIVAALGATP